MKKVVIAFLTLIISFSFLSNVSASRGDLRYNITGIYTSGNNLIIEGWAFIHQTNNFITIYERCETATCGKYSNHVDYGTVKKLNGGQQVYIKVIADDGVKSKSEIITAIMYEDSKDGYNAVGGDVSPKLSPKYYKNYNFYHEMYDQTSGNDKYSDCYNDNKNCTSGNHYYYEDMYFLAKIDLTQYQNSNTKLSFKIAASNAEHSTEYEIMYADASAINVNTHKVTAEGISYKVKMIAKNATLRHTSNVTNNKFGDRIYFKENEVYNIVSISDGQYPNGHKNDFEHKTIKYGFDYNRIDYTKDSDMFSGTYAPGVYLLYASGDPAENVCTNSSENAFCKNDNGLIANVGAYIEGQGLNINGNWNYVVGAYDSWVKPTGGSGIKITVVPQPSKCNLGNVDSGTLSCNNYGTLEAKCINDKENRLDLDDDEVNDVSVYNLRQKVTVTNVLTPTTVYNGGSFNLNFLYYNEIIWDSNSSSATELIKKKIKDKYEDDLMFDGTVDIKLKDEVIAQLTNEDFTKTCNQVTSNVSITTVCLITLKDQILKPYTGEVDKTSVEVNTNNKYYLPIYYAYSKNPYTITGTLKGLNIIDVNKAQKDTDGTGNPWVGKDENWKMDLTECNLRVYDLYGLPGDGFPSKKRNFIYRPIDINNPFPNNRNAGFNWTNCSNDEKCKDELAKTYDYGVKYSIEIDYNKTMGIRSYNKNNNYNSWAGIEDGKSSFITEFFTGKNDKTDR